jgi:hypothetical protein
MEWQLPTRHLERSEGSSEFGSVPITEIPHCVRDDVRSGQLYGI